MICTVTSWTRSWVPLLAILYFCYSRGHSLAISPLQEGPEVNGSLALENFEQKTVEIVNSSHPELKQSVECRVQRCYGHYINEQKCCPGHYCSIHLPLLGGLCIKGVKPTTTPAPTEEPPIEEVEPEPEPEPEPTQLLPTINIPYLNDYFP